MILRKLERADTDRAAALWREIFGDSEAFTSWFFSERFSPAHSFGAFSDGRLVAMTIGRPSSITVSGKVFSALVISGVSTLPAYRRRGLMRALVSMQTEQAKAQGFSCCCLYPDIETLYASLGFRNGTDATVIRSDETRPRAPLSLRENADIPAMRAVYDAIQSTHDGMQLRDEAECKAVLRDYVCDGGETLLAFDGITPLGYLCILADGTVSELLALSPDAYAFLLDTAASRFGISLTARVPSDCGIAGTRVYGMHYLIFNNAFSLPLKNGFCQTAY